MNDITPRTRQEVQRAGVLGIGAGICGGGLLLLSFFAGGLGGLIIGGLVVLGGLGILGPRGNPDIRDRRLGGMVIAVGAMTALGGLSKIFHFLKPLAGLGNFILFASGAALLGIGIFEFVRFVKGVKARS